MSKEKKIDIHIGDKVLFFARLSDITILPDWFEEDDHGDLERHAEKWDTFLGDFTSWNEDVDTPLGPNPRKATGAPKIDVPRPSQWFKLLFATNEKTHLFLQDELAVAMSYCASGFGQIALVDGYPKATIESFANSIAKALQLKMLARTEDPTDERFIVRTGNSFTTYSTGFVGGTKLVFAHNVETRDELVGFRSVLSDESTKKKVHFVDLSDPNWMEDRFPTLAAYFKTKADIRKRMMEYQQGRYGGFSGPGGIVPSSTGGGRNTV